MVTREPLTPSGRSPLASRFPGGTPQYVNAALAVWLFISAFIWPHSRQLRTDTWVVAVLMFIVALAARANPQVRYANTVLAIWLFISTLAMPHVPGTVWNNLIVAIIVFFVSLSPTAPGRPARA